MLPRKNLSLSPLLPLAAFAAFYLGYGGVFLTAVLAALLHECGHLLAAYACGVSVVRVRFGVIGAEIVLSPCSRGREAFISSSGVICNLLFAFLFWMPWRLFSVLHLLLAVFNALPVFPLDGGRLIRLLFGNRTSQIVSVSFCAVLLIAAFAVSLHSSDWLPFAAAAVLCVRAAFETIAFFRAVG